MDLVLIICIAIVCFIIVCFIIGMVATISLMDDTEVNNMLRIINTNIRQNEHRQEEFRKTFYPTVIPRDWRKVNRPIQKRRNCWRKV